MNLQRPQYNWGSTAWLSLLFCLSLSSSDDPSKNNIPWSFSPLTRPPIPALNSHGWAQNPIDSFILQKLHDNRLAPSPAASPKDLLRRLFLDVHGLPPSLQDFKNLESSPFPASIPALVDSLLASPRYGERWARHWIDLIHFAETHGHDEDAPRENAWPYRDYLIRSFNQDKPYSLFAQEQIAGDVLFPHDPQALIATGFLAAGPWDESSQMGIQDGTIDKLMAQYLDRDDIITTTFSTFTSLSVHCARCHDHKFDPIPQSDYYALQSVFSGLDRVDRPYHSNPQQNQLRQSLLQKKGSLQKNADASALLNHPLALDLDQQLQALPPPEYVYAVSSWFTPAGNFKPALGPRPVHRLHRGNILQPKEEAQPGALSQYLHLNSRYFHETLPTEGSRRAALAQWISDSENGLFWRSIANRLWQYHFGQGIVHTPNDFGQSGTPPTHPELLDWLACELRDHNGSLKHLHKLILTSATYQQSSLPQPHALAVDANNQWLWRMNPRRLDAETARDSLLFLSQSLILRGEGPSNKQFLMSKGIHVTPVVNYRDFSPDNPNNFVRSIYRFLFRTVPDPWMSSLDCPDASQWSPQRAESVGPLQALALLNHPLLIQESQRIAHSIESSLPIQASSSALSDQIASHYHRLLLRSPTQAELDLLLPYTQRHGLANTCRWLLNGNEFMFIP